MRWFSLLLVGAVVVGCKGGDRAKPAAGSASAASGSAVAAPTIPADAPATNAAPAVPGIALPEVAATGYDDPPSSLPTIAVSRTALTVDGMLVASLANDQVDPADLEGGAMGLKIVKLAALLQCLTSDADPKRIRSPLAIAMDRDLSYRLLVQILFTASRLSPPTLGSNFVVLAQSGSRPVALPIVLPQPRPADADERRTADTSVRPVVSITKDEVLLWSLTGSEGTRSKPRAKWPRSSPTLSKDLAAALAEIVARRWPDAAKRDDDRTILLQPDAATSMQSFAELAGTVRTTPDGQALFPNIHLSSAFE